MFEALVFIIGLLADKKFTNFRPVLDAYISKHFSGAMAHKSLVACLHSVMASATDPKKGQEVRTTIKALEYIFKFVIQSRLLYNRAKPSSASAGDFKISMNELFSSFCDLMKQRDSTVLGTQTQCLQYFASIFPDLSKLFTMDELGQIACNFLNSITYADEANQKLNEHKLRFMQQLVCGPLFANYSSRQILLPALLVILRDQLHRKDSIPITLDTVGDILSALQANGGDPLVALASDANSSALYKDILQMVNSLLQPLLQLAAELNAHRSHPAAGVLLACLLSCLRLMSDQHYRDFLNGFRRYAQKKK